MPETTEATQARPGAVASINSLRQRAIEFSARFKNAKSEQQESQTFWNEFFRIFELDRRTVGYFEKKARRATTGGQGRIDLLWAGELAVEQKSYGQDLDDAMDQVLDYLPSLREPERPWLLVACDFQPYYGSNLHTGTEGSFALDRLSDNIELFAWMAGHRRPGEEFANEQEVNLRATELLANIHDKLMQNAYHGHALRVWLTRIVFCLFAEDAGVFGKAAFHSYLALQTRADGSNLGQAVAEVFQWLNVPVEKRPQALDEQLRQLTYINGDLFEEVLPIPVCDAEVRDALLEAAKFDWSHISPAIFGSMFQNVMEPEERRQLGAHYTSERDILRTIRPLFVESLEGELQDATSKPKLRSFLDKLANLTFLDPACGCGNFLVLAYREIRRLETEALRRLRHKEGEDGVLLIDITLLCRVRVDQFYGIELEEFPARIARTALYLMDHLVNRDVSSEFGNQLVRFPIPASPHIHVLNALESDWSQVAPADDLNYIFGNPPFGGHRYRSRQQSDELRVVWGKNYVKWLDYVTAWYIKAIDYVGTRPIDLAFVSTSSIIQGEQVARLWGPLNQRGYRIKFAHQPFSWISEARGKAHVHVVIIGLTRGPATRRRQLFEYESPHADPLERQVHNISPYLVDGPDVAVAGRSQPLSSDVPPVRYGNLPADGGGLVVKQDELDEVDDVARKYLRLYLGSEEVLHGIERYCLWMPDGPAPGDLRKSAFLAQRLAAVRAVREASKNPDSQGLADMPYRFFRTPQPHVEYLGIPAQVSETRRWYLVQRFNPEVIASNTLYTAEDPDGFLFGVLSSRMFWTWASAIGGKLEARVRFSGSVVHNTFPLPPIQERARQAVISAGKLVLAAREERPGASLADLYDPLSMSPSIIGAHAKLDRAIDGLFDARKRRWSDADRLSALLAQYVSLRDAG